MQENKDPHQVVISREYFDTLVRMAKINDVPADRKDHPGQTIVGRILWHARKYNRALRNERQIELETELVSKRLRHRRRRQLIQQYAGKEEPVYVIDGIYDRVAYVRGESRRKTHVLLMVTHGNKCNLESVHIDDIILTPRK